MTRAGAFRETGAFRFFFIPKGALTHHLPVGQAVVLPLCVSRALCEADCALCGERQTMLRSCGPGHHCLRGGVAAALPSPAKTCTPAALSQRQGQSWLTAPAFSFAKEKQKKEAENE